MSYEEWKQDGAPWDEAPEIWELQAGPHLTVGALRALLERVDPSLPIRISLYEGAGSATLFDPVEIGYLGDGERPQAIAVTVARLGGTPRDT